MTIRSALPLMALLAALAPAAAQAQNAPAAPAAAAAMPPKQMAPGIAVANRDAIIASSKAFKNANSERDIVYKNQMAMADARRKQFNNQIEPLVKKYREDQQMGTATEAELQMQAQTIQNLQNTAVQELNTMLAPIRISQVYVQEQIEDVLSKAIVAAMDKRGVTMVVPSPNVLAFNNGYDISANVLAELDALLPTASVIPPDGWRPRAEREAAAAQAAQLAPAAPASPSRRSRN